VGHPSGVITSSAARPRRRKRQVVGQEPRAWEEVGLPIQSIRENAKAKDGKREHREEAGWGKKKKKNGKRGEKKMRKILVGRRGKKDMAAKKKTRKGGNR